MKNPDRPVAWGKSSLSLFMACFSSTKNNQKEDAESVKKSKFIFQVRGGMLEKAQPSLWVMLANFKAHENLKVLEGKHMLAREEDALRQHYPSESVCDGSFLEYLEGLVNARAHTHTHREHFAEPERQNRSAILSGKQKTCGFTPAKPHEPFIFFHQIVSVRNWKTQGAVFTGCWNSQSRVRVDIPPCFNKQDSPKSYAGKDGMLSFLGCLSRWCASLMQAQVLQRYAVCGNRWAQMYKRKYIFFSGPPAVRL